MQVGRELGPDAVLLVNLSGRGDKDVHTAAEWFGLIDEEGGTRLPDDDGGAKAMGVEQ